MGTVRQMDMDAGGRVIHDRITALDTTKLNGAVRRISTVYDARGMASTISSWDNATVGSGAIVNQVQNTYDGWGLLERHAIDVNSSVGASGSVDDYNVRNTFVLYGGVGGGASGANVAVQLRRTDQDLYKAATLVQGVDMLYLNASGSAALMDDDLGRVTRVQLPGSSGLIIAEYRYLGLGTVVETDLPGALMRSRLHNATSPATYTNRLDRWNRPIREHWQTYDDNVATLVDFIDVAVTLNAAGSTLKRDGVYYPIEDAKATYDNLGRLTSLRHGTLDGSGNIPIADGRREDVRTFTQAGTVAAWNMDLNFQFDGTTAFAPNYTDLEETKDTRTLNLLDKPTARDTNSDNGAQPEYTIAYDKLTRPTSDGLNYEWVYDGFGRLAQAKVKTGGALVKEFAYDGLGRVIGERYDTDATAGVGTVAQDPWYYKAYDGFSRHVATFRGSDASPKEIYTHHEMGSGGSQLAVRRDVDATGGGGWGGSSDGVLETQAYLLHRANGDVIAVVGGLTPGSGSGARPGAVRERMEYVPGGDGSGSVEPMRLSPSDGYQIGGARGGDGLVTGDDFNAWIAEYAAGTANGATDLNNNGVVDGDDFTAWTAEWDSGALVGRAIMSVPDGADAKGPGNVRGAMAAAGVALDAVLSGKVSGGSGQTGRVRWGGGRQPRVTQTRFVLARDWPLDFPYGPYPVPDIAPDPSGYPPPNVPIIPGGKPGHVHGNWCGSGHGGKGWSGCASGGQSGPYEGRQRCGENDDQWGPQGQCIPTNDTDRCCMLHDLCMSQTCVDFSPEYVFFGNNKSECARICDASMCSCLKAADTFRDGNSTGANWAMQAAFCNFNGDVPDNWNINPDGKPCKNGKGPWVPAPPYAPSFLPNSEQDPRWRVKPLVVPDTPIRFIPGTPIRPQSVPDVKPGFVPGTPVRVTQ